MVEFLLGNKNEDMLKMYPEDSDSYLDLEKVLSQPSIYDAFLQHLSESGYAIPQECLNRDWQKPHVFNQELVSVFVEIYKDTDKNWDAYAVCEQLVDVEQSFQMWRFRHMKTVERIIGFKRGVRWVKWRCVFEKGVKFNFFP